MNLPTPETYVEREYTARRQKNIRKGLWWSVAPTVVFLVMMALLFWVRVSVPVGTVVGQSGEFIAVMPLSGNVTALRIVPVLAGFGGTLSFILMLIGIPLGCMYLSRDQEIPGVVYDERSGKGPASEIPAEIKQWSWGGAGLTWIWGSSHVVWWSLLSLIPGFSIFVMVLLGLKGNEYAWRAKKYRSVDDFLKHEETWRPWGILFFIIHALIILRLRF